jgi:hypothetical protein
MFALEEKKLHLVFGPRLVPILAPPMAADAAESRRHARRPPSEHSGGHAPRQAREDYRCRSPGLVGELGKFPAAS